MNSPLHIADSTGRVGDLALSDLALEAAIEFERIQHSASHKLEAAGALAAALAKGALRDLALVPVYERALSNSGGTDISSVNDLYSRLEDISSKLGKTETASDEEIELLRDFCVELHNAILTNRKQMLREPDIGNRRFS